LLDCKMKVENVAHVPQSILDWGGGCSQQSSSCFGLTIDRKVRLQRESLTVSTDLVKTKFRMITGVYLDSHLHVLLAVKACFESMTEACKRIDGWGLIKSW